MSERGSTGAFVPLPPERLRRFEGWGAIDSSVGYLYEARCEEDVRDILELARSSRRTVTARGSGYSYGDAALNAENIVVDTRRFNRILDWDPAGGIVTVEPGVTIGDLWRHVVRDGWWPEVVPGTMHPTIGGCIAANCHGKNNWKAGTVAEYVESLQMMLPSGEVLLCGPGENAEIFHAVGGGLGMLGIVTSITLRLRPITSGMLRVTQFAARNLEEMFETVAGHTPSADCLVGWIDGLATGSALGRGLVQSAYADDTPGVALSSEAQDLPPRVLGVVPRSWLWAGMKPFVSDVSMRALNAVRYQSGRSTAGRTALAPLARFHFFHDYVPNWKRAFRPGGILQYQAFMPEAEAQRVFLQLLIRSQAASLYPYLAVMKRHRADRFLLGYNVDGYSLSLDFHAKRANLTALETMLERCTEELVLPAGGRFFPAKDRLVRPSQARRMFGADAVDRYLDFKARLDPGGVLQSDLYRRMFGGAGRSLT